MFSGAQKKLIDVKGDEKKSWHGVCSVDELFRIKRQYKMWKSKSI